MPWDYCRYFALCLVALQFVSLSAGYPPLPSKFYQHGRGLMLETWLSSTQYEFDDFSNIPHFPNCPTYASNLNTFQYTKLSSSKQHNRFRAYFVSPEDGKHKFSVLFNNMVRIMIEIKPGGFKTIYEGRTATGSNWANRKWSSEVDLKKGFRYLLMVYHYGNGEGQDHLYLGVRFPDNTEVQPIDSRYLWRSMEFYKWNGVLGQKYDSVTFPFDRRMSTFYSSNSAKYPDDPTEFTCEPSLYELTQDLANYYAMLFIGYMKPKTMGYYTFRMIGNEICELFLTKNNVEKSYGTADISATNVELNIGQLQNDTLYAVKAVRVESSGSDYIKVEHKHGGGSYSKSWDGLLQNLETNETVLSLSPPTPVMINSTAITATLTPAPYIPPRDKWTYMDKYDMLYLETNNPTPSVVKLEFTGSMPRTIHATNLKKYTDYSFYAHYYGYLDGMIPHHITTDSIVMKTDEDEPGAPPTDVTTSAMSSTIVNVTWSDIIPSKTYGIITSYSLKYKRADGRGTEKEEVVFEKSALISGLDEYVEYDIKVAGITSKGAGVYSAVTKQRTLQDVPSLPPLNLRGSNISSTAIRIFWDSIPTDDQNGIITGYNIKYKDKIFSSHWKNVTVSASTFALTMNDLDYYRQYEVIVAGMTAVGIGNYSSIVVIRTDADGPSKPPMNFTGRFANHTALNMSWTRVPKENRHGIIFGYRIYYRDETIPSTTWKNVTIPNRQNGSDAFSTIIGGLKIYTPYQCKITAFTHKSEGAFSEKITVWTDEYVPTEPPRNLTGQNASSTEIVLDWISMSEVHGDANGKVLGYTVKYQVVDCHEDRPSGCNENQVFEVKSMGDSSTTIITNLRKYTEYRLSIQVFNSKGKGNFTKQIIVRTAEDKPDAPPTTVETWPAAYESIKVFWSPIPESLRNGIILGYRVFYRPLDVPMYKYHRAPRSVNPFAAYGGLPGEKMKEVNASVFRTEINGLKHYSWYHIRIGAFTSKGLGATFSINGTCKQSTPVTAPKIEVIDKYDFYEISLKWIEISKTHGNGEVLGYRIKYWLVELQDTIERKLTEHYVNTFAPNKTATIKNLKPYGRYGFTISAFTEGGFGVESAAVFGETCRCPKYLSSARMAFPPLINASLNSLEILPNFVNEAVTHCCGNCSRGHGVSEIDWKRDWSNASSLKYNSQLIVEAAVAGTHITLPLFRDTYEAAGDGSVEAYVYVPILEARKLAIFTRQLAKREIGNAASDIISKSLWGQYPLFVTSAVLIILAGIIFWFFEHGKNTEEFSGSFLKGSGSGIWLTYITMTTVGYGDLTPITVKGKIHVVIVIIVGLFLTSILAGNLCNLVSTALVDTPPSFAANGKVLTSDDTLMLVSRIFGSKIVLGNTSDPIFVQQQLLSGNVSKLAIDTYKAVLLKNVLNSTNIKLEAIKDIEASYGIALAGEAKRVKQCVSRYARENSQEILLKISKNAFTFKNGVAFHTELLEHMTSPYSNIMTNLMTYGGITLVILVVMGTMFEMVRKRRARAKVEAYPSVTDSLFNDVSEAIEALEIAINASFSEIETRHMKERIQLSKMQMGKYEALLKMYPDLTTFDPSIPKLKKQNEEAMVPMSNFNIEESEGDEDSLVDMPIYYKRSKLNLQI